METKLHDKNDNIRDGQLTGEERILVRNSIKEIDPEIRLFLVDYDRTPAKEAKGWDLEGRYPTGRIVGVQLKIRRPDYWDKRGIDFFIEDKDGNRPGGLGWFQLYRKQDIRWLVFMWRGKLE